MTCAEPSRSGRLIVIAGCMFAGKTARLIERLEAARAAGQRVQACKHQLDRRYDPSLLCTHNGHRFPAITLADAGRFAPIAGAAEVFGIDEAQFFGHELTTVCEGLRRDGRTVIVAGLDRDTWGQPFPPLPELKALADECEQRCPPCGVCGRPAEYHQRLTPVVAGNLVGGPGEYEPRCAVHFTPLPPPAPVYA